MVVPAGVTVSLFVAVNVGAGVTLCETLFVMVSVCVVAGVSVAVRVPECVPMVGVWVAAGVSVDVTVAECVLAGEMLAVCVPVWVSTGVTVLLVVLVCV